MPQQHNDDQGSQLPVKTLPRQAKSGGRRIKISDRNSHGDQRHHARRPPFYFLKETFEERPAAIEIDNTGKRKEQVFISCKLPFNAQPVLDHGRKGQNGQSQHQNYPEPFFKICNHHAVVVVAHFAVRGVVAAVARMVSMA